MSKARRRGQDSALADAETELLRLSTSLSSAYSVFNSTDDPELLEASILEISALRSRYSAALRSLKSISGES